MFQAQIGPALLAMAGAPRGAAAGALPFSHAVLRACSFLACFSTTASGCAAPRSGRRAFLILHVRGTSEWRLGHIRCATAGPDYPSHSHYQQRVTSTMCLLPAPRCPTCWLTPRRGAPSAAPPTAPCTTCSPARRCRPPACTTYWRRPRCAGLLQVADLSWMQCPFVQVRSCLCCCCCWYSSSTAFHLRVAAACRSLRIIPLCFSQPPMSPAKPRDTPKSPPMSPVRRVVAGSSLLKRKAGPSFSSIPQFYFPPAASATDDARRSFSQRVGAGNNRFRHSTTMLTVQ